LALAAYIARRFVLTVPALFAMSVIVFSMIRLIPGDPVLVILGLRSTPENIHLLRSQLKLDDPIWSQYLLWLRHLAQGNLGLDYRTHEPIRDQLLGRLPVTMEMAVLSMVISAALAIPLGVLAGVRRGGGAETGVLLLGLLGISIPDFWLGVMLILLVSLILGWLPSSGYVPLGKSLWDNLRHMVLPSITLALNLAAVLTRITRVAVLDIQNKPYLRTAHAKGLSQPAILSRHILRNAAVPIVTVMGTQLAYVLGGAVIIEQLFALPGIGRLTLNSVLERNYPVVQGAVLLVTFMVMTVNILTDVLYAVFDPRIRYG
jgi:peptide/nickel transport system permease protein